jgi:hypothetical protein
VAVLGPVVQVFRLPVLDAGHDLAVSGAVGAQLVRDDHPRHRACRLEESAEESLRRGLVPPVLHQDIQHHAVLVDSPPEVLALAVDLDEDLVQVPLVTRPGLAAAQRIGVLLPELHAPAADGLVGDDHAALKH